MTRPSTAWWLLAGLTFLALVHGLAYWLLCEDAFISFRYAENLAAGQGLVFNAGEYVEGYTNFLWVLLLAGARGLGLDVPTTAQVLGAGAGLLVLPVCYGIGVRVLRLPPLVALIPGAILAGSASMAAWLGSGLETPLYMTLFTAALGLLLHEVEARPRWPLAGWLFALTALTRPEGLGLFGGALLYLLVFRLADRRTLVVLLLSFAAVVVPHLLFRLAYYGYPLPNTYYAKTGGGFGPVPEGLQYVGGFLLHHGAWALLCLPGLWLRGSGPRPALRLLPLLVVLAGFGVVVRVGGDFYSYWRFGVPYLPWLALLCCAGAFGLGERLAAGRSAPRTPGLVAAGCGLAMLLPAALWTKAEHRDKFAASRQAIPVMQALGTWLRDNLPPDTLVAGSMMGYLPYYSGLRTIDMLGIVDAHIAHREMPLARGAVGHQRFDSDYVLSRKPDVVVVEFAVHVPGFDPAVHLHTEGIFKQISQRLSLWPAPRDLLLRREFRLAYEPRAVRLPTGSHGIYFQRSDQLARLQQAVTASPTDPRRHFQLAVAYRQHGLLGEAVAALREASRLNPNHLGTRLNIGYFLLEAEDADAARQEFEALAASLPEHPRVVFGLAEALHKLGQFGAAATRWRQYLQLDPNGPYSPRARDLLAEAERRGGR